MRTLIAFAILLVGNFLTAQVTVRQDTLVRDTTLVPMIALQEVTVSENKSAARAKRLAYLTRKVIKVYPYSKLAAERLTVLNERLDAFDSKYEKKKYIRLVQNYMEDEFEAELKKMSRTDGRILMKLIHRQTGQTTFDLIKAYRSGWNAFWYNTTAGMFDLSLKTEYHPESEEEDFMIESILQKYFRYGILKPQKPAFEIDYEDLAKKWMASN
jgi:hypothetical protein